MSEIFDYFLNAAPTDQLAIAATLIAALASVFAAAIPAVIRHLRSFGSIGIEVAPGIRIDFDPATAIAKSVSEATGPTSAGQSIDAGVKDAIQDAVRNLSAKYHGQVLWQATVQFWVGIIAAVAGLIWILSISRELSPNDPIGYVRLLPGAIVEAIAALFLRETHAARQRAAEFHSRLEEERRLTLALELCHSVNDPQKAELLPVS